MKKITIGVLVLLGLTVAAGVGVLIWWLVSSESNTERIFDTILLEGRIGDVKSTAAFTRIHGKGDMFWWFYPTVATSPTTRPVILWLHGITGTAPSFLANFGMFGPYDKNLDRRADSWVNDYNLLLVDALGTGFSTSMHNSSIPFPGLDENADFLLQTLQSFYDTHGEYRDSPLYICSQGDGSQLALALTIKLFENDSVANDLKGLILGSPVISPARTLTRLGYYLEELGYIDNNGSVAVENFSGQINSLVRAEAFPEAFDQFSSLGSFVNENAGAAAVNLAYIIEKLTRNAQLNYFGESSYLASVFGSDLNINSFMDTVVAPALGMPDTVKYDAQREAAIRAFRSSYMRPIVDRVEYILQNTSLVVNIYNGNLDAVSNTPGQLELVESLLWSGQIPFLLAPRNPLVYNRLIEGYMKETSRLRFYWINVAGQMVPLENPVAIRRLLIRITN